MKESLIIRNKTVELDKQKQPIKRNKKYKWRFFVFTY